MFNKNFITFFLINIYLVGGSPFYKEMESRLNHSPRTQLDQRIEITNSEEKRVESDIKTDNVQPKETPQQQPVVQQPVADQPQSQPIPLKQEVDNKEQPKQTAATKSSSSDLDLLARVIEAEAGAEPYNGKLAVGTVVMNRVASGYHGGRNIKDIIYQPYQFSCVKDGHINRVASKDSIKAAKQVLGGYRSFSKKVLYFCNPTLSTDKWMVKNCNQVAKIGSHIFYIK